MTASDVNGCRALAPKAHFPLTSESVYLDQAAIGLVPTPVAQIMETFTRDLGRRGTVVLDEDAEAGVLDDARRAAAALIAADADRIAIVSSATEVLNQLVWSVQPDADENVVLLDGDFPSVTLPWLRLADETGVELRFAPTREEPERACVAALAEHVDERTAAICVGHVQYATGHRLDLRALAELAHAADAYLIVDATQSVGSVALDLAATPVDALVASSHKWLCAPHGAAFCYLGARFDGIRPPFVGWRGVESPSAFDGRALSFAAGARRFELGTLAYGAGVALGAAIAYLDDLGKERVEAHNLALAKRLAYGLAALGAIVATPPLAKLRAAIVQRALPRTRQPRPRRATQAAASVHVRPPGLDPLRRPRLQRRRRHRCRGCGRSRRGRTPIARRRVIEGSRGRRRSQVRADVRRMPQRRRSSRGSVTWDALTPVSPRLTAGNDGPVPKAVASEQPGNRRPAPPPLDLIQDFVNSWDREGGIESFASPSDLAKWLRRRDLISSRDAVTGRDVRDAIELREAIRALLLEHNGAAPNARAHQTFARYASKSLLATRLDSDGVSLTPVRGGVAGAWARLLAAIADASAAGTWARLKACRSDVCQWAFYDHSKNRSSHWCTMEICGTRAKMRRYRGAPATARER